MKKYILTILSLLLCLLMSNVEVFADSDTTDKSDEVFYEWVENYDNIHSDTYNYDLDEKGNKLEYIDFHESDAPSATKDVVRNFVNTLTSLHPWSDNPLKRNPWHVSGFYTNDDAMERDWDYKERAGVNIETADIAVFGGHGIDGKSMQFNRLYSDSHLTHRDADFGYNDLDWVFLFTCNWLKDRNRVEQNKILGGAHSIMGYGTTMWMDPNMGKYLANLLLGTYDGHPKQVEYAWHEMNRLYPGPNTSASNSTISVVYGAASARYDYIWDMGSVSSYPGNNPLSWWSSRTYTSLP